MNMDQFWQIVQRSREQAGGNLDRQVDALCRELLGLDPAEVADFQGHFEACMGRAYTWELRAAAWMLGGGQCSDEGFADFRSWLISMGRPVYENATAAPETLVAVIDRPDVEYHFFEEFQNVAGHVYRERTGRPIPSSDVAPPATMRGQPWREDGGDLGARFPGLWNRFVSGPAGFKPLPPIERLARDFVCPRCGGVQAQADRVVLQARDPSDLFGRAYLALACRRCGHTDFYDERQVSQ